MATQSETVKQGAVERQRSRLRSIAIVPAHNEEASLGALLAELRTAEPDLAVVVINDGSTDSTTRVAEAAGVSIVNLPFNVGIGGTVQTGYQYALEHGFEVAIQVDGDGQHDPTEIARVLEPIFDDRADLVVGTRFVSGGGYRGTRVRRVGIHIFASVVSLMVGQRVSDTTSGFRAVNRKALRLFASQYPHDYPGGRVDRPSLAARPANARGARKDARARDRCVVDHRAPRDLLHDQGSARPLHWDVSPLSDASGGAMTPFRVSIAAAIAALFLLAVIFELIRSRRLQERYALLWLLTGLVIFVLAIWRSLLGRASDLVGIAYPPSALFILAAFFILLVLLHYSTVISRLSEQNTSLAQRLAILESRLREAEDRPD